MRRFLFASALLLAGLTGAARAESACWAQPVREPTTNDGLSIDHPSLKPLHAAMDAIEQQLRPNPGLLALPDVRLRIRRHVMGATDAARMPREAVIYGHGFGPKAWGRGPCELIAQADRLGPRAGISVFINRPTATLNRWQHDAQLTTYLAAAPTPSFQGWPTFGECAVISPDRRLPWVPVSVGEMLALYEREQQRAIEDWDREHREAFQPFDLDAAEREAERIRPLNAQAAEALLLGARTRKSFESQHHAQLRRGRQVMAEELDDLRRTLQGTDEAQRAAPYRLGTGRHRLPTPTEATQAHPQHHVVKLDPSFAWDGKNRTRIQLLTVCAPQIEHNPAYHLPMREAIAALDFARLAALLN
jgi:hypothetical protein